MIYRNIVRMWFLLAVLFAVVMSAGMRTATAAATEGLDSQARAALKTLYDGSPAAKALGERAKGILVFPNIVKAGLLVGAQGGDGALMQGGKTMGYYNSTGVSYGLQAGVQSFGYVLFLMTDGALAHLVNSKGWEIGTGPSVVVVDAGMAKTLTTTTARSDVYAFTFGQKGLMAGIGLQGSKITPIKP